MSEQPHVLIVESRYYEKIAQGLAAGAEQTLGAAFVASDRLEVAGVFEIPAAIRFAVRAMEFGAAPRRYAGFIALGCVIRGETDHYDHICREASRALMDIAVDYSVALGFGVLTCATLDQARARSAPGEHNKGSEAARACIRQMEIKKSLRLVQR